MSRYITGEDGELYELVGGEDDFDDRLDAIEDALYGDEDEEEEDDDGEPEFWDALADGFGELEGALGRELTINEMAAIADEFDAPPEPGEFAEVAAEKADAGELANTTTAEGRVQAMSEFAEEALQGDDE